MCIKLVTWKNSILWCTVRKTSNYENCTLALRCKIYRHATNHILSVQHSIQLNLIQSITLIYATRFGLYLGHLQVYQYKNRTNYHWMFFYCWEDPDVDERIILRQIFRKWEGIVGTGWGWLRIGTGGGHLWVRRWTFRFHKMRGISWLAAEQVSFSRRTLLHGVSK